MRFRTLLSLVGLAGAVAARAGIVVTLDNPVMTTTLPSSSYEVVTFTGSVVVDEGWKPYLSFIVEPGLTLTGPFLSCSHNGAFSNWFINAPPGEDFSGPIIDVIVRSTDAPGFYELNANGPTGHSRITIAAQDIFGNQGSSAADFALRVLPVPEPASLAALSVGSLLAVRRRRR